MWPAQSKALGDHLRKRRCGKNSPSLSFAAKSKCRATCGLNVEAISFAIGQGCRSNQPAPSGLFTSTVQSGSSSANAALLPLPHLPNSYPLLPPHHPPCSWLSFYASCFLSHPLTASGFFNEILAVFKPEALNCFPFLLSHPVDLICIQEYNLNSSSSFRIPGFSALRFDVVVVTRPLMMDWAWRKTMDPQNPENTPGPRPGVVKRQRVAKERAAQRVLSWTVQNEMRSVLGRVSASAAGRVLDSANPRKVRT